MGITRQQQMHRQSHSHTDLGEHAGTVDGGHDQEQREDGRVPVEEGVDAVGRVRDLLH